MSPGAGANRPGIVPDRRGRMISGTPRQNGSMAFTAVDPASGQVLESYDEHTPDEIDALIGRAHDTFVEYRRTSHGERSILLESAADLLEGEQPDLARTLTLEMGKTFAEAKAEVAKCARCLRWYAEHGEALLAEELIPSAAARSYVRYEPLGPVLAVMPWNFPMWQVIRFAAPALTAGNVGLLKHASNVPGTALMIEDVFRRAGFPEGAFTALLLGSKGVADVIADPRVAAVTLTGSDGAGRSVGAAAGHALKKSVLELGGSDPFVVLPSADLDRTVPTAVRARVQNNGQSCIAAKRFIVVGDAAEDFIGAFTGQMAALTVGDPMDPGTDVGPLATASQRDQVAAQVEDARAQGATVRCGGVVPDRPGWFYPPTVLTEVRPDMRIAGEEVFGPVALVERARDLDEALAIANGTDFGLGASVWTEDATEARRCIEGIEAGAVFVNAMVASTPELPFGGIKSSGYGRELSGIGMREFCNVKTVWEDHLDPAG